MKNITTRFVAMSLTALLGISSFTGCSFQENEASTEFTTNDYLSLLKTNLKNLDTIMLTGNTFSLDAKCKRDGAIDYFKTSLSLSDSRIKMENSIASGKVDENPEYTQHLTSYALQVEDGFTVYNVDKVNNEDEHEGYAKANITLASDEENKTSYCNSLSDLFYKTEEDVLADYVSDKTYYFEETVEEEGTTYAMFSTEKDPDINDKLDGTDSYSVIYINMDSKQIEKITNQFNEASFGIVHEDITVKPLEVKQENDTTPATNEIMIPTDVIENLVQEDEKASTSLLNQNLSAFEMITSFLAINGTNEDPFAMDASDETEEPEIEEESIELKKVSADSVKGKDAFMSGNCSYSSFDYKYELFDTDDGYIVGIQNANEDGCYLYGNVEIGLQKNGYQKFNLPEKTVLAKFNLENMNDMTYFEIPSDIFDGSMKNKSISVETVKPITK